MKSEIKSLYDENHLELAAMIAFGRLSRTIRAEYRPALIAKGLTPTQFGVLEVLYRYGNMCISELLDTILMTSGNITVVIKNMARNGWILKYQDPKDKRSCIISLTDRGRVLIESVLPDHINDVATVFSKITDEEKVTLRMILEKLK